MVKKSVLFFAVSLVSALPALAQETGTAVVGAPSTVRWGVIGAAFLLAIAAAAGATAQGRATAAASEGMSRNPGAAKDIRGMTLLGLVLIESLVLYALLICFLIFNK
ncbi:MAG TPA: ATP synthase F0 subunit C [Thermoanaerobaculia bacterium]|nr:ATP synthase F0 subunit C [Thermoanaerobaculia bacterium]